MAVADNAAALHGLTSAEAATRLRQSGPNAVPDAKRHPLLAVPGKFWAPVPWMLEATIVLELILGKHTEAVVIGVLLIFNAALSALQEHKAQNALAVLRRRLPVKARVLRDGQWQTIDAQRIVPGDTIHVRMGDLVPADVRVLEGQLLLDQSALTGESLPVDVAPGKSAYAGAIVKRGEASGEVTATGSHTYFGKTAELVGAAKTVSHLQEVIFTIVKYLIVFDSLVAAILFIYSRFAGLPLREMLPFTLILLVASVPVALPATFTLATAMGSMELAKNGVLVTRLSAIEEAAAMDVLLSDKTGTITENRLALTSTLSYPPCTDNDLLRFASFASDEASQDPLDLAILAAALSRAPEAFTAKRLAFVPFDPATKLSEATVSDQGQPVHAVKGAPQAVAARLAAEIDWQPDAQRLAEKGYRVLAVASGTENNLRMAGLLAFEDPPRPDSKSLIKNLQTLGIRVVMVTGDGPVTAAAVAAQVGIGNRVCESQQLKKNNAQEILACDIFAGVLPEDKFDLVRAVQQTGRVTGMTGDGVNDAPALKQAEVGIAVSSATDVAKAAASLVLTTPGLSDILSAVETSRRIYQRMLTYTLNKIIKTVVIALFLTLGVMITRTFIITPLLIVLLLFTNDFVTMSIATDNVSYSKQPDRWRIRPLMAAGITLGSFILVFSLAIFLYMRDTLGLPLEQLQTVVFLTLVFTGQGTVYLVRERSHFWSSRPSGWLLLSSALDILLVSFVAEHGVLMTAVPLKLIVTVFGASVLFLAALDFAKIAILRQFR